MYILFIAANSQNTFPLSIRLTFLRSYLTQIVFLIKSLKYQQKKQTMGFLVTTYPISNWYSRSIYFIYFCCWQVCNFILVLCTLFKFFADLFLIIFPKCQPTTYLIDSQSASNVSCGYGWWICGKIYWGSVIAP